MDPARAVDARLNRLETEVAALKKRVQTLCQTVNKHSNELLAVQESGGSESAAMKPPKIGGGCE
jgi:uncharacterized protein YlxW (UPF0749 family)